MFDDYEFYQGIALRQVIVGADSTVCVVPYRKFGRVNAYVLNGKVGMFVKHSSKRMSPWQFTFHRDQVAELQDLEIALGETYVAFVCGQDGLVAIDTTTLHQVVSLEEADQGWVRIRRKPRSSYGLGGNRADFGRKIPQGAGLIHAALQA